MARLAPIAFAFALLATPALAVDLDETAEITLWCAQAFTIVSGEIKGDDAEMSAELETRGTALMAKARELIKAAGISDADAEATVTAYQTDVAEQIAGTDTGENAKFSYDDCMALEQ